MPVASAPPPTKVANVESFVPDGAFMAEKPDATKWTAISLNIHTDFETAERLGDLTLYPVAGERIIFPTVRLVQTQFLGLPCLMFKEAVGGPDLQQLFITEFSRVAKTMDCLKAYTNSMRVCGTGVEGYVTLGFSGCPWLEDIPLYFVRLCMFNRLRVDCRGGDRPVSAAVKQQESTESERTE
ncbi:hypothetical protein FOZ63_007133 [Perkinsus olseni]|uniref:Uncharacterized protein n=1 Tax=Perkinsus olseni TaxID=32597 RepID=A0A7J6TGY4_PEROL|nr:hypothetical protein FOZ63_007133 [Perkinsus olseni]